jgi:hypothetical protein
MSTDSGFYGIHLEQLGSTTEVLQAISAILILGGIAATVQIVWYLFTTKAALYRIAAILLGLGIALNTFVYVVRVWTYPHDIVSVLVTQLLLLSLVSILYMFKFHTSFQQVGFLRMDVKNLRAELVKAGVSEDRIAEILHETVPHWMKGKAYKTIQDAKVTGESLETSTLEKVSEDVTSQKEN